MLGGLRRSGRAVAAEAWGRAAEGVVAGVAVLERVAYGWWWCRGAERWWGRELGCQAVGQEGCRPS